MKRMRNNEQEGSRPNELDRLRKMLDDAGIPYESYQELHPFDIIKRYYEEEKCD